MFKSLQARLTLSYLVVILVCLVLVGLAAFVLLRGYQERLTYSRLADRALCSPDSRHSPWPVVRRRRKRWTA